MAADFHIGDRVKIVRILTENPKHSYRRFVGKSATISGIFCEREYPIHAVIDGCIDTDQFLAAELMINGCDYVFAEEEIRLDRCRVKQKKSL